MLKISVLLFVLYYGVCAFSLTCQVDQHLVKGYFRSGYTRADGTYVKPTTVATHCRSNPESYKYWQDKIQNNRPKDWPYSKEISKSWTTEEIEKVRHLVINLK